MYGWMNLSTEEEGGQRRKQMMMMRGGGGRGGLELVLSFCLPSLRGIILILLLYLLRIHSFISYFQLFCVCTRHAPTPKCLFLLLLLLLLLLVVVVVMFIYFSNRVLVFTCTCENQLLFPAFVSPFDES